VKLLVWAVLATAGALVAAAACTTDTTTTSTQVFTAIYVDPNAFRGGLECGAAEGAIQSYTATLTDVTDPDPARHVVLPTSPPTTCAQQASFGQLIDADFYAGEIDVYDLPPCPPGKTLGKCLVSLGGYGSGARTMGYQLSASTPFVPVEPLYQTKCGTKAVSPRQDAGAYDATGPTQAVDLTLVKLQGCQALDLAARPSGVKIATTLLRGSLTCGEAAGQLSRLEILRQGDGEVKKAGCGEEVRYEPLPAGADETFQVLGFEAGAEAARWGASCEAQVRAGIVVAASCDALTEQGGLRVPSGAACAGGAASYKATIVGGGATLQRTCGQDAVFQGLKPGLVSVRVDRVGAQGAASVLCSGQVGPGQVAQASCSPP
jgi:hypothetical protein